MKKVELLSPVGNMETLYYAIHNGADAVYLAGKNFGARSYASNFTNDELIEAIKYCHLYDVKIYITVNTIIYNDEIDYFMNYIDFLYKNNVDAIIMQDLGMIYKVRKKYPDFEIHASTQMHNNSIEQIKLLKKLGVKRVVLARELSLDEINKFDIDIEKEVFIHGALCISYSGCCLFSSMNGSRSGNRGECVASCRLKYNLYENNKKVNADGNYILSTRELNTINYIDKLIESNIDSLKIEGRMKSKEYVGYVTRLYRKAIDSYYNNEKFTITEKELHNMMSLYNRKFTKGYLFNDSNERLMNIKTQNHQGIDIGKVISFNKKIIKIKLENNLNQGDGIRFKNTDKGMIVNKLYDSNMLLKNVIHKGNIAIIDNKIELNKNDIVSKTLDKNLLDEINNLDYKKINISFKVIAHLNNKLCISITDNSNEVSICGEKIEKSINNPTTKEEIITKLSKLGNVPFILENIDIDIDNDIFVNMSDINNIRRKLCEELIVLRSNKKVLRKTIELNLVNKDYKKDNLSLNVFVKTEEQLKACIDSNVDNIYINDYKLYRKYKNKNIYYVLDRVNVNYVDFENENLVVRELGSINKYVKTNNCVGDYTLNVINNYSIKLLNDLGINRVCLSPELKLDKIKNINGINLEYLVYGKVELMITKYCPMNMIINKNKGKCTLCKDNKYYLEKDNKFYKLVSNKHIITIYDYKNLDYIDNIGKIIKYVNNLRIDLLDENYSDTINIINKIRSKYE